MDVSRRGLFGMAAAAPLAANEVAKKMMASTDGLMGGNYARYPGYETSVAYPAPGIDDSVSETSYLESEIAGLKKRLLGLDKELREELSDHVPERFDPDLASMRSVSPSAAFQVQKRRDIERRIAKRRTGLKDHLKHVESRLSEVMFGLIG